MFLDPQILDGVWRALQPMMLALPRVLSAMLIIPLLPQGAVPAMVRVGIAISLALVLHPMAALEWKNEFNVVDWAAIVIKEFFIGGLIGYALGSIVWAFETMGALVDNQAGTANAQIFDPFGGHSGGPYAPLMAQLAIYLLMAGGGFIVLVSLICQSFEIWPISRFIPSLDADYPRFVGGHVQSMMEVAVKVATPVILILTLLELGIGLINRVAPQFNVFYFSFPIKAALVSLLLAIALAHLVDVARSDVSSWPGRLENMGKVLRTP